MIENIIELVDLTKNYGSFTAVNHLNLSIRKGEIFGLLGPNGAGKSTTILMMLGLTDPTSGSVNVCGIDSTHQPIEVKRKIGYLPEDVGFYFNRNGYENLMLTAQLNQLTKNEADKRIIELLAKVGLSKETTKKTAKYSRGMLQRLGLADVLIKNPEIIILDEPTLGLDPTGVREFLELIVELSREQGITVLFSSHDLHHVQQVCDRVGLFVGGQLLAEGDIASLSEKLFSHSPFIIQVGIASERESKRDEISSHISADQLKGLLNKIDGVGSIEVKNGIFQIECNRDATIDIARTIANSGLVLNYLHKKEYALDDIYYRYFDQNNKQSKKK